MTGIASLIMLRTGAAREAARQARHDPMVRNSVYIMLTTVVNSLLGYVYWVLAARSFSPHDVGLAAALVSVMTLISLLSNLGTSTALIQTLPVSESGRSWSVALNTALSVGTVAGLVSGLLAVVVLSFFAHDFAVLRHNYLLTGLFVIGVPLWTLCTLFDNVFVAERAAGKMLTRNAVFAVAKIIVLLLPLVAMTGALSIFSSWVLATAVSGVLGIFYLYRLGRGYQVSVTGILEHARSMVSSLAGHHATNLGGMAPMYLLPMVVTLRLSAADNAYFYVTWMISLLVFTISASVGTSLFAEGSHDHGSLVQKVRASTLIVGMFLVPLTLLFVVGGPHILRIFGASYPKHGYVLLLILVASAVPDAITNFYVAILRIQGRLRRSAAINAGMGLLTVALSWYLVVPFGIAGVGLAWLGAQAMGSAVAFLDLMRHGNSRRSSVPIPFAWRSGEGPAPTQ